MAGRLPAVAAVVTMVVLAVTLHALEIAGLRRVSHDDTISYLAATGHQGEFQHVVDNRAPPVAEWVPAARWQAFTRVEDRLPLLRIARDLGHHDIHPPVYFWLLHLWALVVGVQLWTGPVLNLVLHLLTAVALWRLARRLLGSPLAAWAVTGVWATLPAVVETAGSTRQYSLAGLWSVLLVSASLRAREAPRARTIAAVTACTALGMLTLYAFGFVVAGLGLVALVDLRLAERRRAAVRQLVAFAAGGMVFLAGQPWIREVLERQREQAEPFSVARLALRARLLAGELPSFVIADVQATTGVVLLAVGAVTAVVAWRAQASTRPVVWLAVWTPAVVAGTYLAAVSPGAAYEARYFSVALPWVAFLPVLAWRQLRAAPVAVVGIALFITAAVVNLSAFTRAADAPPAVTLDGPQPVVLDNLARGVLLRILWDAPPGLPVYAADQPTLLATTDRWLRCDGQLPCDGRPVMLATQVQYDATAEGQAAILDAAREVRRVSPAPDIDAIAERYRLSAPTAAGRASSVAAVGAASHAGGRARTATTTMHSSTTMRNVAVRASAGYGADGANSLRLARYQNSVQ